MGNHCTARQERLKDYSLVEDSDSREVKKIVQIRGAQHTRFITVRSSQHLNIKFKRWWGLSSVTPTPKILKRIVLSTSSFGWMLRIF